MGAPWTLAGWESVKIAKATTAGIEIARPAAEVFEYIADFERNPSWQQGMKECRWTSDPPLRVGSTYDQKASFLGRAIESSFVVTALEAGASITIETTESTFPIKVLERSSREVTAARTSPLRSMVVPAVSWASWRR